MVLVRPAEPHSTITDEPDRLLICISVKRQWIVLLFLFVWLSGWALGELLVGVTLVSGPLPGGRPPPSLGLGLWFVGWTLAGAFCGTMFWWKLVGKELVLIADDGVTIRDTIFGIGRSWRYERSQVRDLRMERVPFKAFSLGTGGSSVAFNYGGQTLCFGRGLYGGETGKVVKEIVHRFSDLAPLCRPPQTGSPCKPASCRWSP